MMVLPGRGPVMVHAVQHDVARRPAERLPLSDRLLVDLTVHHYHHQARYPKGDARADHSVWPVHHERANLQRWGYAITSRASLSAQFIFRSIRDLHRIQRAGSTWQCSRWKHLRFQ